MTLKDLKQQIKQTPKEERDLQAQKPKYEIFDARPIKRK